MKPGELVGGNCALRKNRARRIRPALRVENFHNDLAWFLHFRISKQNQRKFYSWLALESITPDMHPGLVRLRVQGRGNRTRFGGPATENCCAQFKLKSFGVGRRRSG